jgi:acyl-CoA synthetase
VKDILPKSPPRASAERIKRDATDQRLREIAPTLKSIVLVRNKTTADPTSSEYDFAALASLPPSDETGLDKVNPDTAKAILYKSGTTGNSKAVMHSHNTITRVVDNTANYLAIEC